jgi:hypothetical protein
MSIHVITTEYLRPQKTWKCKYEVVSPDSAHYGLIDVIFSSELLKAGHTYLVQVNTETRNPRLAAVIRELEKS